jgi:hypothetical protein
VDVRDPFLAAGQTRLQLPALDRPAAEEELEVVTAGRFANALLLVIGRAAGTMM